uniref:Putative transporter n=1 Tax=Talaromyces marneffei PM1 TaxID=1077442 RepID=A0A093XJZ5_TALMA
MTKEDTVAPSRDQEVITDEPKGELLTAESAVKAIKAGDKDVDIAAQIIANYTEENGDMTWTPQEEKKLMRKVDWWLIPILFVCATLSGLDKTAISAAAIYNIKGDLHLTGQQYSWIGSAPFFGGLAFMGPSAYCLQRVPAVKFFALNVFFWGVLEMCMAACTNFAGLFVCRFFLGGCEALLIPAVTLVVSMWYRPEEQPARNSIILNVIAPILNGLIAWSVSYYHGPFEAWKIIFLVLGIFTVLWAFVVLFFLPDNPLETRHLTSREKYIIIQRKASDNTGVESKTMKPDQIWEAVLDPKTWLIWFAIVALQVPNGGLTTFNTLIISGLGFNSLQTSLLAMPPGAMSTLSGIGLSYLAARTRKYRTILVAVSILLPLFGAVLCYALPRSNLAGQLIGLYILYTYWAPYVTLVSVYQANIAGHTKKVSLYAWYYIAWAVGNIIGPQTFRADQAPAYTGGTIAMIVCYAIAIVLILIYGSICHRENKQREADIQNGVVTADGQDWLDLTDKENLCQEFLCGMINTDTQPNVAGYHTNEPTSQASNNLTDVMNFAYRFDHATLKSDSNRWSNLPELIDLSILQVEKIPEELFAPETLRQPQDIEDMVDACPKDCKVVLVVFRCGYYAFFTAQCFDHFVTTRESNVKPVGVCNPQVVEERHHVPYFCFQNIFPVCDELEKSLSALEANQRD